MNKAIRFKDEFKWDAVAQVVSVGMRSEKWRNVWGSAPNQFTYGRLRFRSRRMYEPQTNGIFELSKVRLEGFLAKP